MFKVSCPKCKNQMNYDPKAGAITTKIKRCVYCGHSFKIHANIDKSRIIERI